MLRDVHLGLAASGVKNGTTRLVQGSYEYYHYRQWTGCGQRRERRLQRPLPLMRLGKTSLTTYHRPSLLQL